MARNRSRTLAQEREKWLGKEPDHTLIRNGHRGMFWERAGESRGDVTGWAKTDWDIWIRLCYAEISKRSSDMVRDSDGRLTVFATAIPVGAIRSGVGAVSGKLPSVESGNRLRLRGREIDDLPGECAERKIMDDWVHKGTMHFSDIWVFYTTHSPCKFCMETMLTQLRDESGEEGCYRHLVVAFEGIYSHHVKALYTDRRFQEKYRDHYDPDNPGIEIFKVHHREPSEARKPFNAALGPYSLDTFEDEWRMAQDPLLSLIRVRPEIHPVH
jgi:hypothetical protein